MSTYPTNRSPYWDNMKGLLILFVVLGHYLYSFTDTSLAAEYIVKLIYLFHMPAFIFITGYFSKKENASGKHAILKLVSAYFIFNTAMMVISFFIDAQIFQATTPYYSYWYLIAVIVWRLSVKRIGQIRGILIISTILAILCGCWPDITNVFALSRIIAFYPFFIAGYLLPEKKISEISANRNIHASITGFVLIIVSGYLAFKMLPLGHFSLDTLLMSPYNHLTECMDRISTFFIAVIMIIAFLLCSPDRELPLLTKFGKNSLTIYLLHRFPTVLFALYFPDKFSDSLLIISALAASVVTLVILGSDYLTALLNRVLSKAAVFLAGNTKKQKEDFLLKAIAVGASFVILMVPFLILLHKSGMLFGSDTNTETANDPIFTVPKNFDALDHAVKIVFAGDLILLEDQVKNARDKADYQFDSVFDCASDYIKDADLAIGVFEGPMAGGEAGYSSGNFDDNIPLYLNYPDSFASAVKNAGFDLVTTANNHLLDKGINGALRTLDILDKTGLEHIGSYRNNDEKNRSLIKEIEGIRFAFLAYTYGSNYYEEDELLNTDNSYLTSVIVSPESKNFKSVKASVLADFERIKAENPDVIIVLPHMGTQFSHETDSFQDTWNEIFLDAGADIILGDHSHAVQPVVVTQKNQIIVNCPGNFANSYCEQNGDATALAEIYIDPSSKTALGASIIPMWVQSAVNGNYRAIPIFDILTDEHLQKEISTYEMERVREVQKLITSVMFGQELDIQMASQRYYILPEGCGRAPAKPLSLTYQQKETPIYDILSNSDTVCFIGDSITAGTRNGGYGWYEPLTQNFTNLEIKRNAWGGATVNTALEHIEEVTPSADAYVIALGTNDIRYRDEKICAMTSEIYIERITQLITKLKEKNPSAEFILVSPWISRENDPYCNLSKEEKETLFTEYSDALKNCCNSHGWRYVNPNPYLAEIWNKEAVSDYLSDHIHPNSTKGISLYSQAFANSSNE